MMQLKLRPSNKISRMENNKMRKRNLLKKKNTNSILMFDLGLPAKKLVLKQMLQ